MVEMIKDQTELQSRFFRGLADSSRLSILETIIEEPRSVSDIVKITKLSQPNTSLHLSCLLECGLVTKVKKGREAFYKVSMKEITNLINQARKIIRKHSKKMYTCAHYILILLLISAFTTFYSVRAKAHCPSCIVYCLNCHCHSN